MNATPNDRRGVLIVSILASSMAFLDGTVVNVALPVMQRDLGASVDLVQWIVEAYALLLASLVLVGGVLGDRLGRRRMLLAGVSLFALASAGCGLAPGIVLLIVARGVQGVGAALLVPGSLSLISAAYPEDERGAAIGTWSAASTIVGAIGPVAGGWVVAHASWRLLFFFNLPVAAVVIALASARVTETRDETAPAHMDWLGASLVTLGLGVIVFALIGAGPGGIGNPRTLGLLAVGVLVLVAFLAVEARQLAPMVPLSLFRSRTFSGTNLLTLLLYAALGGALFFVPFVLIQVHGYTPLAAGAAMMPLVVLITLMSRWVGGLAARHGVRVFLVAGPLIAAAGFALLAVPGAEGSYFTTFFPGIVVLGVGTGMTVAPLTTAVMSAVDRRHAGAASGINNAIARAASLLAIAAFGVVLVARFNHALDRTLSRMVLPATVLALVDPQRANLAGADLTSVDDPALRDALRRAFADAYVAGFRTVMLTGAALAALGALAALWLVEPRRPVGVDGQPLEELLDGPTPPSNTGAP